MALAVTLMSPSPRVSTSLVVKTMGVTVDAVRVVSLTISEAPAREKLTLRAMGFDAEASANEKEATPVPAVASASVAPSATPEPRIPTGAAGAVRSRTNVNGLEGCEMLPARSTWRTKTLLLPSCGKKRLDQLVPLLELNSSSAPSS